MLTLVAALATAHATTFVVDTTDDTRDAVPGDGVCADAAGQCSLHAALDEMPFEPDLRIELPAGDFPHARTSGITHGIGPDDARSLEIVGQGPGQTRVLPATSWLFLVGGQLTLRDLAVEGVDAPEQGAIVVEPTEDTSPTLVVDRVAFRDNHAEQWGGAIALFEGSTATISGSRFERNSAGNGLFGWGGAILSLDDGRRPNEVRLDDTTFVANHADDLGAAVLVTSPTFNDVGVTRTTVVAHRTRWFDDEGRAALVVRGSLLTVSDSLFSDNRSLTGPGALDLVDSGAAVSGTTFARNHGDRGGAARLTVGAGGRPSAWDVAFEDTVFADNESTGAGGAVYVTGGEGIMQFHRTSFVRNRAATHGGALLGQGEGIPIVLHDSWVVGNQAGIDGGGVYLSIAFVATCDLYGSLFWDNEAGRDGGGLYAYARDVALAWDDPCTLEALTFQGNRADGDGDGDGGGGGLRVAGDLQLSAIAAEGNTRGPHALPDDCMAWKDVRTWYPPGSSGHVLPFTTGDSRFAATETCDALFSAKLAGVYDQRPVVGWDDTGTPTSPLPPALGPVQYTEGRPWFAPLPGGPLLDGVDYRDRALVHIAQLASGAPYTPRYFRSASPFDLRGALRRVDGDGDGRAHRDIGAVELQAP